MKPQRLLWLVPALIVGCSADSDVSNYAIIHDLTPELMSTTERPVDVDRHINQTSDVNCRLFWDDMGRAFYTDHPSRLSPLPVQNGSGMPK
jgi:hypothetical protein